MKTKKFAVCTADWHITASKPVNRLSGYTEQQYAKIGWILGFCKQSNADLYFAGDIFDRAREPRWLSNKYATLLKFAGINIFACAGQHDQLYHSKDLSDTSFQCLVSAGLLIRALPDIYCMDWGVSIPEKIDTLIAHFCVTEKHNPFIDYSLTAKEFMQQTKARIMVTGDYHVAHTLQREGRLLINPGTIMRNASDMTRRKPVVYLIDTENAEIVDRINIPVKPADEVFDLKKIEADKERKAVTDELRDKFNDYVKKAVSHKIRPDFDKNLIKVVAETVPREQVKLELDYIMQEAR